MGSDRSECPKTSKDMEFLGYTLSGANTRYIAFQPHENAEEKVREGMFVMIEDYILKKKPVRYYAIIHSIESHHEFLEPGEVWSETLRKGIKPPDKVARKYLIAQARILGQLDNGKLRTADRPPRPGSRVFTVSSDVLSQIYGVKELKDIPRRPDYLRIGALYGYSEEQFPAILNLENVTMHMAVVGITGSGKSNTIGVIIEELGSRSIDYEGLKAVPIMIIDANGDYIDYYKHPGLVPNFSKIYRIVFPESEAYRREGRPRLSLPGVSAGAPEGESEILPLGLDLNLFEINELAELIIRFYHAGKLEGAELQLQLLQKALEDEDIKDMDLNELFVISDHFNFFCEHVMEELRKKNNYHAATVAAVRRAVQNFREKLVLNAKVIPDSGDEATVNSEFIDKVTDLRKPALVIVDFSTEGATAIDMFVKQFVVYYLLSLLFKKFVEYKLKGRNRVLLLGIEEAQNFAPNLSLYPLGLNIARSVLATVATQGRKFGLSLILVTQRPSYVDPIVMSMMNTFIIHRISPADLNYINNVSGGLPKFIREKLTLMEKGLAVITGQMNLFPIPVLVKVRKRKKHEAGSISIFRLDKREGDMT